MRSPARDMVQVDGVERVAKHVTNGVGEALAGAYNDVMVKMYLWATRDWPVKTGFSRKSLELSARHVNGLVVMSLRNRANYAGYIKQRSKRPKSTAQRLVFKPGIKGANAMTERLKAHLSKI